MANDMDARRVIATDPKRRRRATRRGAVAVTAVAVLFATVGCGSSSKPSSAATTAAAAATTPAPTSPAPTTQSNTATTTPATTAAPATTAPPTTTKPASGGGSGSNSSFCNLGRSVSSKLNPTSANLTDPAGLKALYANIKKAEPVLLANAPSAIKGDLTALFAFENKFIAILQKADYNYAKVPPASLQAIAKDAPALESEATAVTTWLSKTCGITPPTTA
jgi:hypothetical protein